MLSGLLRSDQNTFNCPLGTRATLTSNGCPSNVVTSATPFTLASQHKTRQLAYRAPPCSALSPLSSPPPLPPPPPPPPPHTPPRAAAARSIAFSALPHPHPSVGVEPWAQHRRPHSLAHSLSPLLYHSSPPPRLPSTSTLTLHIATPDGCARALRSTRERVSLPCRYPVNTNLPLTSTSDLTTC